MTLRETHVLNSKNTQRVSYLNQNKHKFITKFVSEVIPNTIIQLIVDMYYHVVFRFDTLTKIKYIRNIGTVVVVSMKSVRPYCINSDIIIVNRPLST